MMKQLFYTAIAFGLATLSLSAQNTLSQAFSTSGKQQLVIQSAGFAFEVIGEDHEQISITGNQPPRPERAQGLQAIDHNTVDNTGLGLNIQESDGVITIKNAGQPGAKFQFRIPAGINLIIDDQDLVGSSICLKNLSGPVEFKSIQSKVELENLSGPVSGSTENSDIDLRFTQLLPTQPVHLLASNGYIDLTLPADSHANLELLAANGQVFSDFDIEQREPAKAVPITAVNISGTINAGGTELALTSSNNNIYVRRGK